MATSTFFLLFLCYGKKATQKPRRRFSFLVNEISLNNNCALAHTHESDLANRNEILEAARKASFGCAGVGKKCPEVKVSLTLKAARVSMPSSSGNWNQLHISSVCVCVRLCISTFH